MMGSIGPKTIQRLKNNNLVCNINSQEFDESYNDDGYESHNLSDRPVQQSKEINVEYENLVRIATISLLTVPSAGQLRSTVVQVGSVGDSWQFNPS